MKEIVKELPEIKGPCGLYWVLCIEAPAVWLGLIKFRLCLFLLSRQIVSESLLIGPLQDYKFIYSSVWPEKASTLSVFEACEPFETLNDSERKMANGRKHM